MSFRILRAYPWKILHSTFVGIFLKVFQIKWLSVERNKGHDLTHKTSTLFLPDPLRKTLEQRNQSLLSLP